ncbi:hypothetical protein GCM10010532_018280 [Dactylosporangium siamense]|uniref:Polysaccharide biosynthesis protein n=1 Tax=Dactylosporangium siamense TaxID=685454 RepID=A0A919PPW7_9ACTN|nr:hypothetical protein Dsi01nite_065820 [Dactylosporangium siamense]
MSQPPTGAPTATVPRPARTFGPTMFVLVGLGVQAVTTYATLILSGRILGAAEFGGLAALYVLVSSVATGLFQPLEQEVARRRGHEWGTGRSDRTLLRRALVFGLCLCAAVVAVALVLNGPAIRLLGQHPQLLAAFCVALPGYALCFVTRGSFSGSRRLRHYGLQLSVEGVFRLIGLGVLFVVGVQTPAAYGWLFGLAPWVALALSAGGVRGDRAAPDAAVDTEPRPLVAPLVLLLVSALAAQLLIGAGPVVAKLFAASDDQARTGAFLAALVVVRLPVFLFTAVQPSMLPAMAAHTQAGRKVAFRSLLMKVLAAMGALAILTTVITAALGPWSLKLLFGPDYVLSTQVFLLMGVSVGLFMTSGVLGQAVLALGKHGAVTLGWLAGIVGLAVGTAIAHDALYKATMGLLIGAAASTATFTVLLATAFHRWRPTAG